jgi:Aspartyl protease/PDZ domain
MRHAALAAIVALVLGASGPASPAITAQRAAAAVTVPFELATRHVIVKVSVNRSRPLAFVLDTGANLAIIRTDTAKELGLSLHGTVSSGGAGAGRQAGSRVKGASWSLPGLDGFAQPITLALPLPLLPSGMGRDIDGIIGGEFIKQFVLELDYAARAITLHDRASFVYRGRGETLPLDFNSNGHPVLAAAITPLGGKPIEHKFLLDIGSGLALALHSPFVLEQNLLAPESKTIRATGLAGAGGRSFGRLGRVAALQIGRFTINNPIALFSQDKAGAFADGSLAGNIGAQIASRFRLFLDYGRRRIILEPSPTFADPFDRAFSGLSVRAEGPGHRTFRVHEVLEDSPATEAGILEGDIIAAIDGTPAEQLTLSQISEWFEKPVARTLTIRRAEQTINVTVTPRKLI